MALKQLVSKKIFSSQLCTLDCPTLDHSKCIFFSIYFEWVGGSACRYTHNLYQEIYFLVELFCVCFEAVLVRDCEAIDSADLGTSSKESYWDYNRGWPKRRKVPCCSLVRRGWVSPERMAETVLKQPLNPLFFICFGKYFSTFSGFARTGSWLIFQHQYSFSAFLFLFTYFF
jgi:hypothetical protein